MRNKKSENGVCAREASGAVGAMMLLGAVLAAHGAFAAAVADGARAVNCPEGPITNVVRAAAVPATDRGFTVAFRFKASPYVKRPGPWEGLVFANGNGWDTGFRATVTPDTGSSPGGFRMSLRVVKPERGGVGPHRVRPRRRRAEEFSERNAHCEEQVRGRVQAGARRVQRGAGRIWGGVLSVRGGGFQGVGARAERG